MKINKDVLLLFSGGKDSFLCACKLLNNGYNIYLVTYENGFGLKSENVNNGVERLINKFGLDRVKNLGTFNISGIFRNYFLPFFNLSTSKINELYGDITYSQFNCLICRTSMYIYSIALCKKYNINYICEGARISQGFAIEQKIMIDEFKALVESYSIDLITPMLDFDNDWKLKNELIISGFVPKTLEPQCLLGVPLDFEELPKEVLDATIKLYKTYVLPKVDENVKELIKLGVINNGNLL